MKKYNKGGGEGGFKSVTSLRGGGGQNPKIRDIFVERSLMTKTKVIGNKFIKNRGDMYSYFTFKRKINN